MKLQVDTKVDIKSYRSSTLYATSSETFQFVNIQRDIVKSFPNFYHSLHILYHDILRNLMIFKIHLVFIEFKND